jgi:hypothetical protein
VILSKASEKPVCNTSALEMQLHPETFNFYTSGL